MSSVLVSARRQSPSPEPVAPSSPFPGLPPSRSSEFEVLRLVGTDGEPHRIGLHPRVVPRVDAHRARPGGAVDHPYEALAPLWVEAEGNSGTACVAVMPSSPDPVWSGTEDRFVRCPVGLRSRLITSMGCAAVTSSRHLPLPLPVPNAPVNLARRTPAPWHRACATPPRKRERHRPLRRHPIVVDPLDAHLGRLRPQD